MAINVEDYAAQGWASGHRQKMQTEARQERWMAELEHALLMGAKRPAQERVKDSTDPTAAAQAALPGSLPLVAATATESVAGDAAPLRASAATPKAGLTSASSQTASAPAQSPQATLDASTEVAIPAAQLTTGAAIANPAAVMTPPPAAVSAAYAAAGAIGALGLAESETAGPIGGIGPVSGGSAVGAATWGATLFAQTGGQLDATSAAGTVKAAAAQPLASALGRPGVLASSPAPEFAALPAAAQDDTEQAESMESAPSSEPAATPDGEEYAKRLLHLYRSGDQVQAWVRDAALGQQQALGLAQAMAGAVSSSGAQLAALTVNGKRVPLAGRGEPCVGGDADREQAEAPAPGRQDSIVQLNGNGAL
ncbi:hypothetical protein GJ699_29805 [Duganella sp. FT80W]|uniref:Uncharacterized protein n=1 Tax=Duganella guangzhouensis TaxID=2666084 RepID=A0A6I2LBP8_9BURK|nr:hypothetical protein [Duganella guangzhouensis]MRW94176.1 hypothetical protein [Duganella guangzhouensis]